MKYTETCLMLKILNDSAPPTLLITICYDLLQLCYTLLQDLLTCNYIFSRFIKIQHYDCQILFVLLLCVKKCLNQLKCFIACMATCTEQWILLLYCCTDDFLLFFVASALSCKCCLHGILFSVCKKNTKISSLLSKHLANGLQLNAGTHMADEAKQRNNQTHQSEKPASS